MSLPAVDALAHAYPHAMLDLYVGNHSRDVFDGRACVSAVRPAQEVYGMTQAIRLGMTLKRARYDTIVVLERSRWLRLAATASGARTIAAMSRSKSERRHESEAYLDTVRALGINTPWDRPLIAPDDECRAAAARLLEDLQGPVAVLQAGGAENPGARMLTKRWPADRFAALATTLEERGLAVVLTGGAGDRDIACGVARNAAVPESRVLAGRLDLMTTAALIEKSALYVGGDTGVSHVAAAVGTPSVVIFGPTNPRRYRPLGRYVEVVAPPASWHLPDVNLRRSREYPPDVAIDRVDVQEVLDACDRARVFSQGLSACPA